MIRNLFVFLAAFVASALIALVVRARMFQPHADHEGHPAAGGDYASMVSNPLTPANEPVATKAGRPPLRPQRRPRLTRTPATARRPPRPPKPAGP
jgi:hypothetical protein